MSAVEQGHGRVFPRPDGSFAKCFGPPHCMTCQLDADAKERALAMPLASRLALARALVPEMAVVPREAPISVIGAGVIAALEARKTKPDGMEELGSDLVAGYTAMLTAAEKEPGHGS